MSTTALPPNLSPAYQPRSFRGVSPYPAPPSASSSKTGRSLSAHRLEHPLPSRPSTSLPPVPGASARVNAEPISAAASSSGNGHPTHRPPPSPAMSAFDERRGRCSGLRNEVKRAEVQDEKRSEGSKEKKREDGVEADARKEARSVLQLLRRLPAPLPEFLPSTYLPPRNTKKSPTPEGSFTEFVHAQRANTSSASSSSSSSSPTNKAHPLGSSQSSLGKRRRTPSPLASRRDRPVDSSVGLGLGLVEAPIPKKSKSSVHLGSVGSAAMTPSASLPLGGKGNGPRSPELLRTASTGNVHAHGRALTPTPTRDRSDGYRPRQSSNHTGSPPTGGDKISWSRAKWGEAAEKYTTRALLSKRHGDAHNGIPKPEFAHLPADTLLAYLRLTDAVLMYIYSFWANEQSMGRIRGTPYAESQPLREMVRKLWERYAGSLDAGQEKERDMARGMIGLMYLIDAVVNHHLATETIVHLGARNRRLSQQDPSGASSASMTRGGDGSTSATAPHGHGTSIHGPGLGPSPSSDGSPSNSLLDPSPHSASSTSPEIPADISTMITNSVTQSSNASQSLLNARHYLSLSRLKRSFPDTFDAAINCELSDEALPAPNDTLGAARKVDIDRLDQFVWPIELGMCAPIAHLSVFGRSLLKEFAEKMGKEWDVKLGEKTP